MAMTLMTAARKICNLIDLEQNTITEIYFVDRKVIHQKDYIRGLVMKSYDRIVIVPDMGNCEYILQYDINRTPEEIIRDLIDNQYFSQRDAAILLRYSQSNVSRMKNK